MITKNITNLLSRGNLTPRERFLLLVHNDLERAKIGKDVLTEADKMALENWHAKTDEEAREWNQLNEGWKLSGRMNIEAELHFKDAQVAYLSQLPVLMNLLVYPGDRRASFSINALKRIKKVTIDEAVEITRKQKEVKLKEGMDFDYAVYEFAFELLAPDDRKRMKELYEDIEFDHQYLDQEEIIANLYGGKAEMSDEAKDKLADLVAEKGYNRFAKEYQLFHYFACIPLLEVARYFLKTHGIEIAGKPMAKDQQADDEDEDTHEAVTKAMQEYADGHSVTMKAMLREGCRRWLDKGLLDDYTPLVASNGAELLTRWFAVKAAARKKLLDHVAVGDLVFRERTDEETRKEKLWSKGLYGREFIEAQTVLEDLHLEPKLKGELDEKRAFETFSDKVITGDSLYAFKGDYAFMQDFKKRTDIYDANLGLVYAENDPEHKGDNLDQELLICDLAKNGEAAAFSRYGMSVAMLSGLLRSQALFEDFKKNGKLFLKFKNAKLSALFATRRQALIDGYAILLGFEMVFKKLSPLYETDMAQHVVGRIAALREDIEQHNKMVRIGTNTNEETEKSKKWLREEPMLFEEDLTIDIGAIEPDKSTIKEHDAELKEIFPNI
jgi:hypothetical protein